MKSGIMKKSFIASALVSLMATSTAQPSANILILSSVSTGSFEYPSLKAELVSNNVAEISWSGFKKLKAVRFELEKSSDAQNFTYVTALPCNANESSYIVKDRFLFEGPNYYRLKIVDAQGNHAYTNSIGFNSNELLNRVQLLSTSVNNELLIWLPANTRVHKMVVSDMLNRGTTITAGIVSNTNLCSVNIEAFKAGVYKLALYTNAGIYTNLKFSKN